FQAGDDLRASLLCQFQQPGFDGIVNHVEDVAGVDFLFLQGSFASIAHADGGGVDDDVEGVLLEVGALDGSGVGSPGELLRRSGAAVQDVDFGSAFFEAEDGGAGCASGSEYQDLRGVRVGVIEVLENGFFVGHGDAETVNGDFADAGEQVFESLGVQREIDGVHVLAAEGSVHDGGRKGVGDGITGDSVDAGGGVDLLDAIEAAK